MCLWNKLASLKEALAWNYKQVTGTGSLTQQDRVDTRDAGASKNQQISLILYIFVDLVFVWVSGKTRLLQIPEVNSPSGKDASSVKLNDYKDIPSIQCSPKSDINIISKLVFCLYGNLTFPFSFLHWAITFRLTLQYWVATSHSLQTPRPPL